MILTGLVVVGGAAMWLLSDSDAPASTRKTETPAAVQDSSIKQEVAATVKADTPQQPRKTDENKISPMQPIAKAPVETAAPATPPAAPPAPQPQPQPKSASAPTASTAGIIGQPAKPEQSPTQLVMAKDAQVYQKARDLRPHPNMEMSQNDIAILKEMGVRNKTLAELTRLLFDNVPSNIGNIYKGQEVEYGAALLNSNRQAFKRYGTEYVCQPDAPLRIPAYKSPRLPAVYPK